jgi:hypothetical protein
MNEQGGHEFTGVRTESYLIGEHLSRISHATEALIWNNAPPEIFVGTYGIMVDLAEIYCWPWLKDNAGYKEAMDGLNLDLPDDLENYTAIMDYVHTRNRQLKAIYMAVHEGGVIWPKDIPLEDARQKLLGMMKNGDGV